jgi:PAS domain S-box-containing protein
MFSSIPIARRVALLYLFFGMSWIVLTDRWWLDPIADCESARELELLKGSFYVCVTAVLLYWLISRHIYTLRSAHQHIQAQRDEYRLLFDSNPHPMWVYDLNNLAFLAVNEAAIHHYGYSEAEFLAMTIADIHPPELLTPLQSAVNTAKTENYVKAGVWKHRKKDGTVIDVEIISNAIPFASKPARLVLAHDLTAQRQAEARVRRSEEQLRLILENMPVMLDAFDQQGHIILWNRECERVTGYSAAKIVGNPEAMKLLYPDKAYLNQQMIAWASKGNHYRNWEWQVTCKDGTVKTVSWSNLSGQFAIPGWVSWGIGVDVTDRKQAEVALQRENTFRQQIIDCMAEGLCVCHDVEEYPYVKFTVWNQRMVELTGYTIEEINRWGWYQSLYPDSALQAKARERMAQMRQGNNLRQEEWEITRADGDRRIFSISTSVIESRDGRFHVLGLMQDVTDRQRAELQRQKAEQEIYLLNQQLEQQNRDLERLVEQRTAELLTFINALPDQIFVIDQDEMKIQFCNDKLAQDMGLQDRHALQGKCIFETFPRTLAEYFAEQNRQVFKTGEVLHTQEEFPTVNGTLLHMDTYKIPLKRCDGKTYALIGTSRNITELVRARQALAERTEQLEIMNRELDSFSYSVSHDLRAPLRHIGGFVNALKEELRRQGLITASNETSGECLHPKLERYLTIIEDSTRHMAQLIDGLLTLSRAGRQPMVWNAVNLRQLVERAIALVVDDPAALAQAEFTLHDLPMLQGDATLLQQVFTNLIDNAIKFSRDRTPARITIGALEDGTIYIQDNGVGFQMEYADQLFAAFQRLHSQREFQGTGIGLAIVQRIIHRHGGEIWAESQPEQGATFFISFPGSATL